jgi:aldose sugar dehydrogenase
MTVNQRLPKTSHRAKFQQGTEEKMSLSLVERARWIVRVASVCAFLIAPSTPCLALADDLVIQTERIRIRVKAVAEGLEHPWSLAFLPDGRMLVTERPGRLRIAKRDGSLSAPLPNVPAVAVVGQGGLLDVATAPDFRESGLIYFSYSEARDGGNGTSVARARLSEQGLTDLQVVFRQLPAADSPAHFGSRLVFRRDGSLFITLGERALKHFTIRAQGLDTHFGKIVRITPEGRAPDDNPFLSVPGAMPEIWSYGHRNVQGAALHPRTGELWITEHGPKGGDELNIARSGANYGWPLVTYGVAYSGDRIGIGAEREGIEKPIKYWAPSIGTSGLAFCDGSRFPQWNGNLLVGGLYGVLVRLELDANRVVHEETLLPQLKQRFRDVRQGPDGLIYVLTDSPRGKILRIEPAAQ